MKIFINANIAQFNSNDDIVITKDSFLIVKNGKIIKIDKMINFQKPSTCQIVDIKNRLITASLIDCHTHLIYGGNRTHEFEQRLTGTTYTQIAEKGGGIASTIRSTREESFDEIYKSSSKRLENLIKEGVTTVEIKTGYGLDLQTEMKMLHVALALEENYPIHIEKTFLGAHCIPPEYKNDANSYIDYICDEMMPKIASHVNSVDAYCEYLAFSPEQVEKVYKKAKEFGLHVKIHAEQFSLMGATKLACSYGATSSDHLEYIDEDSIKEMAKNTTVAVLLPGAYYFLRETKMPPIELFRKHGVTIAVATDLNPGTSALCSLQLMMNMSSVIFRLTVNEVFAAVTKNASKALGLQDTKGSLEVGFDADFCVWNCEHPRDLICSFMPNLLHFSVKDGERIYVY